jgi:hypothetical protein
MSRRKVDAAYLPNFHSTPCSTSRHALPNLLAASPARSLVLDDHHRIEQPPQEV